MIISMLCNQLPPGADQQPITVHDLEVRRLLRTRILGGAIKKAGPGRARDAGDDQLDPHLLAGLWERFDKATGWGILANRLRDWHDGNHPGYRLAKRLTDKAEQVWLFTRNFAVPWTNNASAQALRGPKRHQAISGYWHTSSTLGAYLRVRSYLVSARGHGIHPIDAIHRALAGTPWLPTPA